MPRNKTKDFTNNDNNIHFNDKKLEKLQTKINDNNTQNWKKNIELDLLSKNNENINKNQIIYHQKSKTSFKKQLTFYEIIYSDKRNIKKKYKMSDITAESFNQAIQIANKKINNNQFNIEKIEKIET